MEKIVTRFAPSPTGFLQAGNYRTALFAWLFARKNKGRFILRIEDTDKERSEKEYEDNIIDSLKWLGLDHDGFERQSERASTHRKYLEKLVAEGKAFISRETPKEPSGRTEVIRFKNPNKKVSFVDLIRGKIEFDTTDLGDFVIAKSLDEPVFHLAVVTDDHDMGITHVIRGEDHISNTPRQILIAEALGFNIPKYAHIPLLLAPDRSKLSKRKGAKAITEYRDQGFLPEAMVNYLALLGWNPGDDREVMKLEEIMDEFDLSKVQKAGAIFDEEKLRWMNKRYMSELSDEEYLRQIKARVSSGKSKVKDDLLVRALPVIRDRAHTFGEAADMFKREGELGFIVDLPSYDAQKLPWKGESPAATSLHLKESIELISSLKDFSAEKVKAAVWPYAEKNGKGSVLWPMRYALTGQDKSPDPFICASILGKDETSRRVKSAIQALTNL